MATSGTTGNTTLEVADLFDHIVRRCGVMPDKLTPEVAGAVKNSMYFFLSGLSNRGINLWKIVRTLLSIKTYQSEYTLQTGTLDVLEALWRTPQRLSGTVESSAGGTTTYVDDGLVETSLTQSAPGGNISWDFTDQTVVNLVGLLPNGTATLALVFQTSPDNVTWTTIRTLPSASYTDHTWYWYELEPSSKKRYFRVRETSTGTLNFREIYLASTWTEVTMSRMNRDDYSALPSKRTANEQPLQFWLDRQLTPKMVLWPIPINSFRVINLFTHMHIEDIGAISNTLDIPQRWYNATVANVALDCILDIPGADLKRYEILKEQADRTLAIAESEERDASPTNITPNIGVYTA
jgi:hypothetical protein